MATEYGRSGWAPANESSPPCRQRSRTSIDPSLVSLIQTYEDAWPWDLHNRWVEDIQRAKHRLETGSANATPEQRALYREEYAANEELKAIHYRDSLEEFDIRDLMRRVCPTLLEHMPLAMELNTLIDGKERSKAYTKLEGLVLANLKTRQPLAEANVSAPALAPIAINELPKPESVDSCTGRAEHQQNFLCRVCPLGMVTSCGV